MSTANEPDPVTASEGLRVEFVEGGDPGDEVVAAVTALLTRPVLVLPEEDHVAEEPGPTQSAWVRAARLEGIVHGRRITTRADLAWRRSGRGSA